MTTTSTPTTTTVALPNSAAHFRSRVVRSGLLLPAIALVIAIVGGLVTPGFADSNNLQAILRNASIIGIAAVGMSFVTVSGNFISLGVQQSAMLAAVLLAAGLASGLSPAYALPVAIIALALVSVAQGVFVSLGLNPVVTTLAVGTIIFGAVSLAVGGRLITFPESSVGFLSAEFLGIPVQVFFFIIVTVVATTIIRHTIVGRYIRLAGANPRTAVVAGISVRRATVWAFVFFGVAVTIAGVLGASLLSQGGAAMFSSLTFDVVAAILVGGIAVQGGLGSPWQAAMGAVFISLVNNLLVLHGASEGLRQVASGVLVLGAVTLMHMFTRRQA